MKKFAILLISFYQKFISPSLLQLLGIKAACRFSPTCSEYAKISISHNGILKGSYMSLIRILKCQPFYKASSLSANPSV